MEFQALLNLSLSPRLGIWGLWLRGKGELARLVSSVTDSFISSRRSDRLSKQDVLIGMCQNGTAHISGGVVNSSNAMAAYDYYSYY